MIAMDNFGVEDPFYFWMAVYGDSNLNPHCGWTYLALCLLFEIFYAISLLTRSPISSPSVKFSISCARLVHDSSSTLRMLHSVQKETPTSVPSMDPGAQCNLYFFFKRPIGRPRNSLPSGVKQHKAEADFMPPNSSNLLDFGPFCGVHTECSICVIFGKIGSLTLELGGLVSKLGSTYTPPSQHLRKYALQLSSSPTKSIVQLQAHNQAFQLVILARVAD
jgi:hypothetical protein